MKDNYANLKEFTLHTDAGRLVMKDVTVIHYATGLNLVGTVVKTEAFASTENPNIVFKRKVTEERFNCIRLVKIGDRVVAFERQDELGAVIWDNQTSAVKLPAFMRKLLDT